MNLHAIVRPAINAVNPDREIVWLRSDGGATTTTPSGRRVPAYLEPAEIRAQIQPVAGDDLRHVEYLNLQGVLRKVYAFGDIQGVVRPDLRGGDILQFGLTRGGPVRDWLVSHVLESWTPDTRGWCAVIVTLQGAADGA